MVGEETNKLAGYIAAVSRHLEAPLAVIVQSSSAAGKSSLMEAILAFVPEEQRVQYSAMTGQSLFYMGETDLKHKMLAIAEEEGASRAAYALKLLQSEGVLTIASTGKDPATGRLVTHEYRVEGPVMIFLTTTAIDIDEELLNRCLVLTVNEDREQTQAIHRQQREQQTLEGLLARAGARRDPASASQRAAALETAVRGQSVRPRADVSRQPDAHPPRSHQVSDAHPLDRSAAPVSAARQNRRAPGQDHLLHRSDARPISRRPTGWRMRCWAARSTNCRRRPRRLLLLIDEMVSARMRAAEDGARDFRFSRRDVRAYTGWGDTQLKVHLHRLEELEYLLVHRGGRGQSFVYELLFERRARMARPVLPGSDRRGARLRYDGKKAGSAEDKAGPSRPQVGGMAGGGRGESEPITTGLPSDICRIPPKLNCTGLRENPAVAVAHGEVKAMPRRRSQTRQRTADAHARDCWSSTWSGWRRRTFPKTR